jgi:energy-converting hydrogenase B subunit D
MTGFWILDLLCLLVILLCALLTVALRNRIASVLALSGLGTVQALLFVVLNAPDVAHAEIVVGSIAVPVLYLIAISKIRTDVHQQGEFGESATEDG